MVVIGGGLAGIASALVLAERGARVTLIERADELGGKLTSERQSAGDGERYVVQRTIFDVPRSYYNLRVLLSRIDPELSMLRALPDVPVLGPNSRIESFRALPRTQPLSALALLRGDRFLSTADLRRLEGELLRTILGFDPLRDAVKHDASAASDFLSRAGFPPYAREVTQRFFARAGRLELASTSVTEFLSWLYVHFLGNPEGLDTDVVDEPAGDAIFAPLQRLLESVGVEIVFGEAIETIERSRGDRVLLQPSRGAVRECDAVVLGGDVGTLRHLVRSSPTLRLDAAFTRSVDELAWGAENVSFRLYFDRPVKDVRPHLAFVVGHPPIDTITLVHKIEGEARRHALRTGGSVVHLQAYAPRVGISDSALRDHLLSELRSLYPELVEARVVYDFYVRGSDTAGFPPGSYPTRPRVNSPYGNVVLAGEYVRLPFPAARTERAVSAGLLAANQLLDRWDVRGEPIYTVPPRGIFRL